MFLVEEGASKVYIGGDSNAELFHLFKFELALISKLFTETFHYKSLYRLRNSLYEL